MGIMVSIVQTIGSHNEAQRATTMNRTGGLGGKSSKEEHLPRTHKLGMLGRGIYYFFRRVWVQDINYAIEQITVHESNNAAVGKWKHSNKQHLTMHSWGITGPSSRVAMCVSICVSICLD